MSVAFHVIAAVYFDLGVATEMGPEATSSGFTASATPPAFEVDVGISLDRQQEL
ncbi:MULTISPECIES: hypothetical protein [Kocuria]|uniref:hypothetical protein n=1 Tax=Kocuria TaxID=57493 RepID=UPI000AE770C0|nr:MULTISPECIES: hypothetical protein [Kocuria]MCT1367419.1 hypothetical protein [Rothia sp. p3-SID1597]